MRAIAKPYKYELDQLHDPNVKQTINFVTSIPKIDGTFDPIDGTTNEEVLEMLIDRLQGLYKTFPDEYTIAAKECCVLALRWLNIRQADRRKRGVLNTRMK